MTLLKPNRSLTTSGARWVLKKHLDLIAEYTVNGPLDFTSLGSWVDRDGTTITATNGAATTAELQSAGLRVECTATNSFRIDFKTQDFIPGLQPRDQLFILWKIVNISLTGANALTNFTLRRNTNAGNQQVGGWRLKNTGAAEVDPHVISSDTVTDFTNAEAHANVLLAINVSGLMFEYRKQTAAAAFPTTPAPEDIALFTDPGNFNGRFSCEIAGAPVGDDFDLSNEVIRAQSLPGAGSTADFTLSDIWVYRLE